MGDPHNLQPGGPGGVCHEAEDRETNAAWTTVLEIVWIAEGGWFLLLSPILVELVYLATSFILQLMHTVGSVCQLKNKKHSQKS